MREEGKISGFQAMNYAISIVLATAILFVPSITAEHARQDAWLSLPLAGAFGALVTYIAVRLALRFPGETVVQYTPRVLGPVIGKLVGFIYVYYYLFVAYFVQREFSELMNAAYLERTPMIVIIIVLTALAVYLLYQGLEVLCRVNTVVLWSMIGAIFLIVMFGIKEVRLEEFLPVLDNGPGPVILGAVAPGSWFGETTVILMLMPFILATDQPRMVKFNLLAVLILFLVLQMIVVAAVGQFGAEQAATKLFPTLALARHVDIPELPIFSRQDAVFMVFWVAGMLFKLTTFFYAGTLALAQWLNLKDYRPLILPLAVVITALSFHAWIDIAELKSFSGEVFPFAISFVQFFLTGLILAVAVFRGIRPQPGKGGGT
ncbi:MAG: spore germination protein [Firmicutes bacterium]|nr:spore germination protein [Bacillota bacterium]MBV1727603.1 spore germination protein [Desulforudis sp.]MBU4532848.1 spore germination protein [Bacillota bacterium]MBU4554226.1 spore germination protein [Bacillota bacterium]MBV1734400.1 spore germination protein [Desulforudis sp.]